MKSRMNQKRPGFPAALAADARRRPLAILVLSCLLGMIAAPGASAQEATPTAGDLITAAECTVAPRSEEDLRALFREVAATPVVDLPAASPTPALAPTGTPAEEPTVAAVTATWREYLACITAGDQARMFALLSDDMVRRQFVVDIAFGVTEDALFDFLAATPVPLPPDDAIPLVPFTDVLVLADGRVAALGPGEAGRGDVRIFIQEDGRWLLDDWYDLT